MSVIFYLVCDDHRQRREVAIRNAAVQIGPIPDNTADVFCCEHADCPTVRLASDMQPGILDYEEA